MTDPVNACPRCGALRRVYKCECEHPGRIKPVEMPAMVAERLRELTDVLLASCTPEGTVSVRVYRHTGVQIGGHDRDGLVGFSREQWRDVQRTVENADSFRDGTER